VHTAVLCRSHCDELPSLGHRNDRVLTALMLPSGPHTSCCCCSPAEEFGALFTSMELPSEIKGWQPEQVAGDAG
jgi:hypothetical protein